MAVLRPGLESSSQEVARLAPEPVRLRRNRATVLDLSAAYRRTLRSDLGRGSRG